MTSTNKITDFVSFNPKRTIKKGEAKPFVEMAALPVDSRDISEVSTRTYTGGGSRFQDGDTLFARITPCLENGKTAKASGLGDGVIAHGSTEFIVMSAKEPEYDEDFVYYLARMPEFRSYAQSRMEGTSGRQRVSWQSLAEFDFEFPEKEERKKIGSILKSLDDKIKINNRLNQTLEQIAQAIFKSWFVDFDPVKDKMAVLNTLSPWERDGVRGQQLAELAAMSAISTKDEAALKQLQVEQPDRYAELAQTAALFPSAMQESELGEIPGGWAADSFSKVASLDTTSAKPNDDPDKEWNHFSIPAFDVDQSPVKEIGSTIKSGKYKVKKSAVLSSKLNPHFPRTWWPDIDDEDNSICSTEFMQFIPNKDEHRTFMYCLITSAPFQEGISQRVTGTTGSRQRAQPTQVAAMNVVIPNNDLMDRFSQRVLPILEAKSKNIKQNNSLSALRDSLLPKLLAGEISLSTATEQAQ